MEVKAPPQLLVMARGLRKSYPLFPRRRDRLRRFLGVRTASPAKVALEDVSFSVKGGEALGVVGLNGSGKTTLLRLVAGISQPDAGSLAVATPIAAILELGLGFHPDFTGKENALLYGTLLGISQEEMTCRLDDILDFAELRQVAHQPLRTYSSGMAARLAFAVATAVEPAVLVVDEALAVGDGAFQRKCISRMLRFKEEGRAILFCSHSLYLIASFCERVLWLREGQVAALGPTKEVLEAYQEYLWRAAAGTQRAREEKPEHALGPRLTTLSVVGGHECRPGQELVIRLGIEAPTHHRVHVGVAIDAADGLSLFTAGTQRDGLAPLEVAGSLGVELVIPSLPLAPGHFLLTAFVFDESGLVLWDRVTLDQRLAVKAEGWSLSLLELPHQWKIL